ncbi:hypothetical protein BDR22DRAFT_936967 [Usnea florida]
MAEASSLPHRSAPSESKGLPPKHVRDIGLTRLDNCTDDSTIVADVVFVHGLQGHPWKTWRYKEPRTSKMPTFLKKVPQKRVFWPRDLLADDVTNIRIFTYGYDSNLSHYGSGPANQSNIHQHGLTLLNDVSAKRRECQNRPLIFVAHSLGGLLVKQALIESEKQARDGRDRGLHETCHAVIFFGTPHRGSGDASMGRILAGIATTLQFDVNKSILRDLDPGSGSPTLSTLMDDFNSLLTQRRIEVYTFQESAGKSGFGQFNGKVVPEESSSLGFRKFEQRNMISKNHMEMCRFSSKDDEGYEKFLVALRDYIKDIEGKKAERQLAEVAVGRERQLAELEVERERREDLLRRLDYDERLDREMQIAGTNASPLPSTFEWIWTIYEKTTSFQCWLTDREPVFWIQGKPGSGKSILMDYLSTSQEVSRLLSTSKAEWTIIRFFFDFRSGTATANNFEGLLRSLLHQMVDKSPGLETGLGQTGPKPYTPEHISKWNSRSLQDAFYRTLANFPTALCLFIDGLDEYGGKTHELVRFFFSISKRCGPQARHKVCLASRPEEVLALGFGHCPGLRMQDYNTQGIEECVRNMLDSNFVSNEQDRDAFSKLVANQAEGVFLWARFAALEVITYFARGENLDELNRRLDEVPREMNEIYSKIFGRMSPGDRQDAQLMFQLVCFAIGSSHGSHGLTLLQLKEAVGVAKSGAVDPADERRPSELERFRRTLRAKSGGLLEEVRTKASGTDSGSEDGSESDCDDLGGLSIRLIHRTVKSYLDQKGWLLELRIDNDSFTPHALWLHICCEHLQSVLGPSESRSKYTDPRADFPPNFLKLSLRNSLIQYACDNLFYHARFLEALNGESSYKYLRLVSPSLWMYLRDKCRPLGAYEVCDLDWGAIARKPDTQPWQIAIEQGLSLCSGDVIEKGLYTPQGDDEAISIALVLHQYITSGPLDARNDTLNELVTLLLEWGAAVSPTNIVMCLRHGTVPTLEGLLDSCSKDRIEAEAIDLISELTFSSQTHEKFETKLDSLLARGKKMIQLSGPSGTVFHNIVALIVERHAVIGNTVRKLKTLIDRGVNIEAPSLRGTPLQLAWRCFHSPELSYYHRQELAFLMKVLVENGANTDWTEPNGTDVNKAGILDWCGMSENRHSRTGG